MELQFPCLTLDNHTLQVLHKGPCLQGLYPIQTFCKAVPSQSGSPILYSTRVSSASVWHQKLGHPSISLFQSLIKQFQLPVHRPFDVTCFSCNKAKSHKLSFPVSVTTSSQPFDLVHMDVWGPAPVPSVQGYRYYLLIIDDFSRYSWLFPLHYKSDVKSVLSHFKAYVKNQFNTSVKTVRSDNGGEFVNNYLCQLFLLAGVIHQTSCPHTPEQNGVVERKHRHLIETTLTLLIHAALPTPFWLEALTTSVFLANRLPHSSLNFQVPFSLLFHTTPDYFALKPFGCACFPWLKPYNPHKLLPKSATCVFLGYCSTSKGYRCYDPLQDKVYVSRHVKFDETCFPYQDIIASGSATSSSTLTSSSFLISLTSFDDIVVQVSLSPSMSSSSPSVSSSNVFSQSLASVTPTPVVPDSSSTDVVPDASSTDVSSSSVPATLPPVHPMTTRSKAGIFKPKHPLSLFTSIAPTVEPKHFTEAVKHTVWQKAMAEEYEALVKQDTWVLVPPPDHGNIIGCQWIYKIKRHSDGSIARYKARLVANGNQQSEGMDYTETFSPVLKQPTLRIVLSLAVHFHWPLRQLDVSNAFLHGILSETVYMKQPLGYKDPHHPNHVCQLTKALYGLKQAPRAWYAMFSSYLLSLGFISSKADTSLFILHKGSAVILVLVYVDDIIVTGSDSSFITTLVQSLSSKFVMKDLGSLHYFLGLEVSTTSTGLFLSQAQYASEILIKAGMEDCKPSSSPISAKVPIDPTDPLFPDVHLFRSLVGSLQYLTLTKPEISFSVNVVCQHMHQPRMSHFGAVKRILRYVKGTLHHGLHFIDGPLTLTAFADADWAGDPVDRRSTTGFAVFFGSNLISWCAKKQHTVARSSTEAEYRAMAHTAADLVWIQQLLTELHVSISSPHVLWCDNRSAIALASNPVFHARTKHIEIDYHFIREQVLAKRIVIYFIGSNAQIADIFTKGLPVSRFRLLKSKLMVGDPPISLQGGVKPAH